MLCTILGVVSDFGHSLEGETEHNKKTTRQLNNHSHSGSPDPNDPSEDQLNQWLNEKLK